MVGSERRDAVQASALTDRSAGRPPLPMMNLTYFRNLAFRTFVLSFSTAANVFASSSRDDSSQLCQHKKTGLPWIITLAGTPIEPSFVPLTGQ